MLSKPTVMFLSHIQFHLFTSFARSAVLCLHLCYTLLYSLYFLLLVTGSSLLIILHPSCLTNYVDVLSSALVF
jgi:hypothetical protein